METLGGYIHFEIMIYLPVLMGIFALMAGRAIIRGEEEKESLDLLLSTPHSRLLVLLQKAAVVTVAVVLIVAMGYLCLIVSAAVAGVELSAGGTTTFPSKLGRRLFYSQDSLTGCLKRLCQFDLGFGGNSQPHPQLKPEPRP